MSDEDELDGEFSEVPALSSASMVAGSGQTMMQTRGSYTKAMTVQKPREVANVEKRLMQEARLAGESFYYGWGSGKNRVDGKSIGLAMAAARCWGNCAIENHPVQETGDSWLFTVAFVDLETGFTVARQFRQSKKWTVHGKHDPERKDDMRFQIGQSKAARNVILKALPEWLLDKAEEAAREGVRAKLDEYIKKNGIAAAIDLLAKALAKAGVKDIHILDKFGVASLQALDIDNLVVLKGDLVAIQKGQEFAEHLFPLLAAEQRQTEGKIKGADDPGKSMSDKLADELLGRDAGKSTVENSRSGDKSPSTAADPIAVIKAEFAAAQTEAQVRAVYDRYCGPDSALDDETRTRAANLWEMRRAELKGAKD